MKHLLSVWGNTRGAGRLAERLKVWRNSPTPYVLRWRELGLPRRLQGRRMSAPLWEINKSEAIRAASHKFESLRMMAEGGVRVPAHSLSSSDLHGPVLGRRFYHTKGLDVEFYEDAARAERNGRDGSRHEYFVKFLNVTKEYRYHVAFGQVILPTVKLRHLPDGRIDYRGEGVTRNHQDGEWEQVTCVGEGGKMDVRPGLERQALLAMNALGLDFGAVDLVVAPDERGKLKAWVLEVNTAPGLEVENRLDVYAEAIEGFVRGKEGE